MIPRPVVSLLVVLLAYVLAGHLDFRGLDACQASAVTHNEVFK